MSEGNKMNSILDDCLFRYRKLTDDSSADKNINALEEDKLYFSTPENFNDPFDNLIYVNKEALKYVIQENWKHMDDYLNAEEKRNTFLAHFGRAIWHSDKRNKIQNEYFEMVDELIDVIKNNYRKYMKIICFSEDYKSELMWSHYTGDHKGFLMAYDKKNLENISGYDCYGNIESKKLRLSKVNYLNEQVDMTGYIHDYLLKILPSSLDTSLISDIPVSVLRNMATRKSCEWSYEREWRLIPRVIDIAKESNFNNIELSPKAIILGARCNENYERILRDIAYKKEIPCYKMKLNTGIRYGLDIE